MFPSTVLPVVFWGLNVLKCVTMSSSITSRQANLICWNATNRSLGCFSPLSWCHAPNLCLCTPSFQTPDCQDISRRNVSLHGQSHLPYKHLGFIRRIPQKQEVMKGNGQSLRWPRYGLGAAWPDDLGYDNCIKISKIVRWTLCVGVVNEIFSCYNVISQIPRSCLLSLIRIFVVWYFPVITIISASTALVFA